MLRGMAGTEYWTSQVGAELGQVADWAPWYIPDPDSFGIQVCPA